MRSVSTSISTNSLAKIGAMFGTRQPGFELLAPAAPRSAEVQEDEPIALLGLVSSAADRTSSALSGAALCSSKNSCSFVVSCPFLSSVFGFKWHCRLIEEHLAVAVQ